MTVTVTVTWTVTVTVTVTVQNGVYATPSRVVHVIEDMCM
jgi:hypothetical protein